MKLRFTVPQSIIVEGSSVDELQFGMGFRYEFKFGGEKVTLNCEISGGLPAPDAYDERSSPEGERYFGYADWHLRISDPPNENRLESLLKKENRQLMAELLVGVANACIRAIRYSGNCQGLHELTIDPFVDRTLVDLKVEISRDSEEWKLFPAKVERLAVECIYPSNPPILDMRFWQRIARTIDQGATYIEADERFVVNSLDHMNSGRFHLAILEIVIGLEIVMSQLLDSYFFFRTLMPKAYRNTFVSSPNLTLEMKLKGVLYLILRDDDFNQFDIKKVLKVVSWRNKITHGPKPSAQKRSDLPQELMDLNPEEREKVIRDHVVELIRLIRVLTDLEDELGMVGSPIKKTQELPPFN